MRKALMGLILAATVMTPVAAEAQRGRRGDGPRVQQQDAPDDGEGRAARAEQRQQRREAQQVPQVQQPQVQVQQQQPQVQVVQRDRGGNRGGGDANRNWRGDNNNNNNNNNNDNRGEGRQGRERTNQPSIYPQAWQGNPNDPRLRHYQELERRNQQQGYRDGRRADDRRDWRNDNRNDRRDARNDRGDRRNNWNRGWRNDRRYDWQRWRYSNRNIFNLGPYYSPYRGYGYNRFSIGLFLEPLFFSQRFWIGDPWEYRLPPAYPGTQWVRYYNDVLLVDVYSGEVLDVIYDFFY